MISCTRFKSLSDQGDICRFCAQTKSNDEIICFSSSVETLNKCIDILDFFKIDFINLTNNDNLPRSICVSCYEIMQNSYSYFKMVKQTQYELNSKYLDVIKVEYPDVEVKIEYSLDPRPVQTNSKPKECKKIPTSQSTSIKKVKEQNMEAILKHELKINTEDVPDSNLDADISSIYVGIDVFSENKSWACYSWQCSNCPSIFPSLTLLRSHSISTHRTCNTFTCNDCVKTFPTFDTFIDHVRSHNSNLSYICCYCNKHNKTIEECTIHERKHIELYQNCKLCGDLFENTKLLSKHKKKLKQIDDLSDDSLSSLEFDENIFVIPPKNHKIELWKDYPWICRICKLAFKSLDFWRSHNKEEHKKCGIFKCFDCSAYRPHKLQHFISHIQQHRQILSLQCYLCNEILKDKKQLTKHKRVHKYNISCEICGETFNDKDELTVHIQLYRQKQIHKLGPLTNEDLTCKICERVFTTRKQFWCHKSIHKQQIYPCDKCGKTFQNKNTLDSHLARYNKKYECDVCGKCFAQKAHVSNHLMTHTDERPFCCDTCGFKCRDLFRLKQHKLRHTNNAPFICCVCNKAFKTALYLRRHEVQHTGEKPFACKFCDKTFRDNANRHKHMKRIHAQFLNKIDNIST